MVRQTVPQGDAQGVLDAIDQHVKAGKAHLMNIGDIKGRLVEDAIARYQPLVGFLGANHASKFKAATAV